MLRSRSPTAGSLLLSMLSLKASMRATKVGSCTGKPCSQAASQQSTHKHDWWMLRPKKLCAERSHQQV